MSGRSALVAACLLALVPAVPARAQSGAQLRTRVDYVAGSNLYLTIGEGAGIMTGDTVRARRVAGEPWLGLLRVVAATAERSVVTFLDAAFAVTRGDSLLIERLSTQPIPPPRGEADSTRVAALEAAPAPVPEPRSTAPVIRTNARVDGRIGVDFDVLDSRTSWGDAPEQNSARRFTTPALRLHARAAGLPGGLEANVNLRWSRRITNGPPIDPAQVLRIYQASVRGSVGALPLTFELGRFYDPHDAWVGYWDGATVRAGGALGAGLVMGFAPVRTTGGVDTGAPRYAAFVDYRYRAHGTSWEGSLSWFDGHGNDVQAGRERALSATQRLRVGGFRLDARLRGRHADSGEWWLEQADADAVVPLAGPLQLRGHYTRIVYDWSDAEPADTLTLLPIERGARRERAGGSMIVAGQGASFVFDVSRTSWDDRAPSTVASASLYLPRTAVAQLDLSASASRWWDPDGETVYVAPSIGRSFGRAHLIASYRFYRTDAGAERTVTQGVGSSLSWALPAGWSIAIRADVQRGEGLSSDRIFTSLSRAF